MRNILNKLNYCKAKLISLFKGLKVFHHYLLISLFLAICVFGMFYYDFYQVAQSESGIFFYPSYIFQENLNGWGSYYFGSRNSQSLAYTTFIFRFFIYPEAPFPFLVQYSYYLLIILIGWYGFHKCLGIFYQSKNFVFDLYLALIYIFNPASLSVLYRFQYPYITFYFLLPCIFYLLHCAFYAKDKGSYLKHTLFLNIVLSIFSIMYASMPTLIMLFTVFGLITFFAFINNLNFKYFFFRIVPFYLIWLCINMFWLIPLFLEFTTKNTLYNSQQVVDSGSNFGNLQFFSKRDSTLFSIFSLLSYEYASIFSTGNNLTQSVLYFVSFIPLIIILVFFYLIFKKLRISLIRNRFLLIFTLLLMFFLIRGLNFPFSKIYEVLFTEFTPFQIFRNPFEKGIMLFALPYLILFAIALSVIYTKLKKKSLVSLILVLYISPFIFLFLSSRLLLGLQPPFNDTSQGFRIEFPYYYREIKSKMKESGLVKPIIIPIVSEGITYNWEKGYIGQDILHSYLSSYGYSFNSPDRFFDRRTILNNIYYAADKKGLLKMYGFDSIVTRKDFDFESRTEANPEEISRFFLEDYSVDFKNQLLLKDIIVSSSVKKLDNVMEGSSVNGSENFSINSDWERKIFIKVSLNESNTFPAKTPFVLVLDSDNVNKIEDLKIRFHSGQSFNFNMKKNEYLCKDCFSSEVINIPLEKNIESFVLSLNIKDRSQDLGIKKIYKIPVIKNNSILSDKESKFETLYLSDRASLYGVEKSKQVTSTNNIKEYENFNYFLSYPINSDSETYIQSDRFKDIKDLISPLSMKVVDVSYKKKSESEYEVFLKPKIGDSNVTTIVTLKTSADSFWKVVEENSNVFGKTYFESDNFHFMSNTFSNSFIIKNIPVEGKAVRLIFLPQYYSNIFLLFSILFFVLLSLITITTVIVKKLNTDK